MYVKDQFIRGIAKNALQADLLAKAGSLKTLEQNVSHAQAFEMAMRDQNKMSGISDIARLQMSTYRRQKQAQNTVRPTATNNCRRNMMEIQPQRNTCRGCGSFQHGKTGSGDRPRMCPAWGQTCRACSKQNHFEGVCQSKGRVKQGAIWCSEDEEAVMDALIAHMIFDPATNAYKPGNNSSHKEVEATLIPFSPCPDPRQARDIPSTHPTKLRIYPDSGATICLSGTKHLRHMGISEKNLVPSSKKVRTVGGFSFTCQGWLPVTFKVEEKTTKQALYICRNVQVLYFSKDACIDVCILPPCFPRPMISLPSLIDPIRCVHSESCLPEVDLSEKQKTNTNTNYLRTPPFSPTSKNVHKLKKWLLERFANTVFNSSGKFPAMSGRLAHIHLKEGCRINKRTVEGNNTQQL